MFSPAGIVGAPLVLAKDCHALHEQEKWIVHFPEERGLSIGWATEATHLSKEIIALRDRFVLRATSWLAAHDESSRESPTGEKH